mgnify:CR=1 FL=1
MIRKPLRTNLQSLIYSLPATSTTRLQRAQSSLARVICKSSKRDSHSNALLKTLHWLPISQRINFSIALLTFKILYCRKTSYLADLISFYQPSRTLRSTNSLLLSVPGASEGAPFPLQHRPYGTLYHSLFVLVRVFLLSASCLKLTIFHLRCFNFLLLSLLIDKWTAPFWTSVVPCVLFHHL